MPPRLAIGDAHSGRRRGRRPSNRVFTLNGDAHSSSVIDPKAGELITNLPLGVVKCSSSRDGMLVERIAPSRSRFGWGLWRSVDVSTLAYGRGSLGGCEQTASVVDWLLLDVIDHEDGHGATFLFQFQTELLFDCFGKRECAVGIRCGGCAVRC